MISIHCVAVNRDGAVLGVNHDHKWGPVLGYLACMGPCVGTVTIRVARALLDGESDHIMVRVVLL